MPIFARNINNNQVIHILTNRDITGYYTIIYNDQYFYFNTICHSNNFDYNNGFIDLLNSKDINLSIKDLEYNDFKILITIELKLEVDNDYIMDTLIFIGKSNLVKHYPRKNYTDNLSKNTETTLINNNLSLQLSDDKKCLNITFNKFPIIKVSYITSINYCNKLGLFLKPAGLFNYICNYNANIIIKNKILLIDGIEQFFNVTSSIMLDINIETSECYVCYISDKILYKTNCGHIFCASCIEKWFLKNSSCPYCRYTVS